MVKKGTKRGPNPPKIPDEILTQRVLDRCLELMAIGLPLTDKNISKEKIGCCRDKIRKIKATLIKEGLITVTKSQMNQIGQVRFRRKFSDPLRPVPDNVSAKEKEEIEQAIAEIRAQKESAPEKHQPVSIVPHKVVINPYKKSYS